MIEFDDMHSSTCDMKSSEPSGSMSQILLERFKVYPGIHIHSHSVPERPRHQEAMSTEYSSDSVLRNIDEPA